MKHHAVIALTLLLSLSACDDMGTSTASRSDAAPRGTFSSGVNGMSSGGAPERGEHEKLRLDNRSQRPSPPPIPSGGAPAGTSASSNAAADRDLQNDTLTGRSTTLGSSR